MPPSRKRKGHFHGQCPWGVDGRPPMTVLANGDGRDKGNISSSPIALGTPSLPGWFEKLPRELQRNGRLLEIAREAATMPCIAFDLPAPNLSAGRILEHCVKTIDRIYNKWSPIIFKIGWTHNPCFRWGNSLYGYVTEREKWAQMCVLHISHEPFSTAMLEAVLWSNSFKASYLTLDFKIVMLFLWLLTPMLYIYIVWLCLTSVKNIGCCFNIPLIYNVDGCTWFYKYMHPYTIYVHLTFGSGLPLTLDLYIYICINLTENTGAALAETLPYHPIPGKTGSKNVRLGGDTVNTDMVDGVSMCYVVQQII